MEKSETKIMNQTILRKLEENFAGSHIRENLLLIFSFWTLCVRVKQILKKMDLMILAKFCIFTELD